MTIELNREAIAQVAALPAVTEAAEAGSALISLWARSGRGAVAGGTGARRSRLGAYRPVAADRSHANGQ